MTLVAGDDVIGLCGLRAVQKFRVGRVGRNGSRDVRLKELTLIVEHGEHRRDLVRRKRKFRPREHGRVFLEARRGSRPIPRFLTRNRKFESISLQQTVRLSPAATFERQEPGLSPQVCEARLTTGSAETQRAFHCAPTGGNVSAGPYSSTAVRLMRSAAMPRRSERNQEFPGFSVGRL